MAATTKSATGKSLETAADMGSEKKSGDMFQTAKDMINETIGLSIEDPFVQAVTIGILVIFLTTVIIWIVRRGKSKRQRVLILGLCDAGKTSMLSWLLYQKAVMTHTSIKENNGIYKTTRKKCWHLFDLPGHEKLRQQALDEHKTSARSIIFVLDSQTLSKEIKDVAEFLYNVLSDTVVTKYGLPILVACNKQDLTLTKAWKVIKSQLEKEIDTVRITRSAALTSTSASSSAAGGENNNQFLGKVGQDFQFSHLPRNKVTFVESSTSSNPNVMQLDDVRAWLERL